MQQAQNVHIGASIVFTAASQSSEALFAMEPQIFRLTKVTPRHSAVDKIGFGCAFMVSRLESQSSWLTSVD